MDFKAEYYKRLTDLCDRRDARKLETLCFIYKSESTAPFMIGKDSVHEYFQQKYEHVKSLLKDVESARLIYARYDTYLFFKTIPPDVSESMPETLSNLSMEKWEKEALKLTGQKERAAYTEQQKLVTELESLLHESPHRERNKWVSNELNEIRYTFGMDDIHTLFKESPLMDIMDLFSQERYKFNVFILEEWGKLHCRLGQEERKWIESIKQQIEEKSKQREKQKREEESKCRQIATDSEWEEFQSSEHEDCWEL